MKPFLTFALAALLVANASAQTPNYSIDWQVDHGLLVTDAIFPPQQPYWIRVSHQSSEWFSTSAGRQSSPQFLPITTMALYDDSGQLLSTVTSPRSAPLPIEYGSVWDPGDIGSPTMLTPNRFYFIGVAPGGTVFHENYAVDFVQGEGAIRVIVVPAPATAIAIAGLGLPMLRRRR